MTDPYANHIQFFRAAWGRTELWRLALMVIGFEVVFFMGPVIVAGAMPTDTARNAYFDGLTPLATLAQFATFGVTALGFVLLLRVVHDRGFWSLVGAPDRAIVDLWNVTLGVGAVLLVLEVLPPWIAFSELAEARNLLGWLLWLPFALVVLLIQVTTEEIYFRGYLQQQLACLTNMPVVWMGIPSILFGAAHFYNGYGFADGVLWGIWATMLGLACADLTARTGTLGAAIGLHLANNIFAVLIVGMQNWPSSGLALFLYPYDDPAQYDWSAARLAEPAAILELVSLTLTVLVMWLAARIALRR
ncbi:CPBP family intramembrane glutamic endopeptidase [Yoonia sp. SS1-5]|uniref:Lysostaphin resistance A-like protein n=1 Tax=Yoonia rhodophyticola TaxID=3137370 RepID=A0AAN0NLD6_9RHOB